MKKLFPKIILLSILFIFFVFFKGAKAESAASIVLDKATIKKGYTFKSIDKNFTLSLTPAFLDENSENIRAAINDLGKDSVIAPNNKNMISNLYEFEIKSKDFAKPYILVLNYSSENDGAKAIYFYNKSLNKWSEIKPFFIDKEKSFVKIKLKIPYAQLAVLEEKPMIGKASWYKYKNCDCTASPDYPKGTLLKVTNLDNNKHIIVKINDYGPDRSIFPDRVVDLDVSAFKKIGNKSFGVIDVKVEKL